MAAQQPESIRKVIALRVRGAIARDQFELTNERLERFWKIAPNLSRRKHGIDRERLRAALLERLEFWRNRR